MSKWRNIEIGKVIDFNPSERIPKGKIAKKIAMEKLTAFEKKIKGYELSEYVAGPKFRNGDTLVAKITPCLENGKTAQVDILNDEEIAFGSSEFIVLRNNEYTTSDFVFYLAKSPAFRKKAIGCMEGTSGRKRVNEGALKLQVLPIPDISSQKGIASILSALDAKIELNNRINAELEAMAKTIYDYWFVQFDFPDVNGKPYKTSGGKMVWNEELKREIPEGWRVGTLLDIANYENGLPCQKFRPIGKDSLKVIKIREMNEGFSSNTELVRPDIPIKAIVENGDILFSWSASLDVKIWTGGKGALNQHIFKVTSDLYPKSFYYFQLLNYLQHFKMMAENRKTTMGHITQEHLQQSRIAIPPRGLIFQLDNIIASFFDKIINNKIQNQQFISLRDWLLPMLMNGQVTVAEAEKAAYQVEEVERMEAEPMADLKKDIAKPTKQEAFLRKLMLASHIVCELCDEPTFGHTKLMKLLYLSEQVGNMALQTNYKKFAAGPFDGKTLTLIDQEYKKNKWFTLEKRSYTTNGQQREATIYKKTEKSLSYKKHFDNYFEQESDSINTLISLFRNEKTQLAEIVATLYFAWNELLVKKTIISEVILTKAFYDFHQEKRKFTREQIMEGYRFMLEHGVHP